MPSRTGKPRAYASASPCGSASTLARRTALCCWLLLSGLAFPATASAHGIVGKADLPIPVWLFSWAAAIVLVVSFVALSTLWLTPKLQTETPRRLFAIPCALAPLASAFGLGVFALVVYSGFAGAQAANANFAVTFIYVVFWVGLPVLSLVFGDFFAALSPWRTFARCLLWLMPPRMRAARRYPSWLGTWPAVIGLAGFGWLELVYLERDVPSTLAALSLGYFAAMVTGMLTFGVEQWSEHGDGFAAYFSLVARLSPLAYRDCAVYVRRPLSGAPGLPIVPGTVALVCTIIGTTTFDGLSNGGYWKELASTLVEGLTSIGLNQSAAVELVFSFGLLGCIVMVAGVYRLGVGGLRTVSSRYSQAELSRRFVHTLLPIAIAYVLAHYFSFVIWQGQAMRYLISDPLGNGANVFGTASTQIDYTIISYAAIWYVQVAALLLGHVGGLALAHDRALAIYRSSEDAIRSQYWMLGVMVAFTSFGLWLLSAVGT
ncbi:MAG TPA: fenitrothion hydrolase [Solirubrobacteraceae bacterium]|jgi:hypothetical protein